MGSKLKLTQLISFAAVLVALTGTIALLAPTVNVDAQEPSSTRSPASPQKHWDATAPGRVEPSSQTIRVAAPVVGRIAEVVAKVNEKVFAGELLVRLDDDEARARLVGAEAQVALHQRARNDERRKGSDERRRDEDAVADAERSVVQAQAALDKTAAAKRGAASGDELEAARAALSRAQARLREQRDRLAALNAEGATLPTRAEGELTAARADLTAALATLEKTRVRAPLAGTVLQVQAKVGEMAVPSSEHPLVLLGDVTALQVRAELDERDFVKVRVGQRVLVRAHAFRDREFQGRVASVAQYVQTARMTSAEQRKLSDIDVAEVIVALTDPGPLVVGMQVDAYFSSETPEEQGAR